MTRSTGHRCAVMMRTPGREFIPCLNEATHAYVVQGCSCPPGERDPDVCEGPMKIHECDGPHDYGA